jgi:hypothetical protein
MVSAWAAFAVAAGGPPAIEPMRGLEAQKAQIEWKASPDQSPIPEESTRRCQVFGAYALLGTHGNFMGTEDLEFRSRPKGMTAAAVCGAGFKGHSVRPRLDDAIEPMGVFGHNMVGVYPDGFGIFGDFSLVDLETGVRVYRDQYEYTRAVVFEHTAKGPLLTYWSRLDGFDCIPRRGESACWNRIREKHHIPATVPQPDCEKAVAERPSILQKDTDSAQIAVHVRVPRLSRRDATYLSDRPSCGLAD